MKEFVLCLSFALAAVAAVPTSPSGLAALAPTNSSVAPTNSRAISLPALMPTNAPVTASNTVILRLDDEIRQTLKAATEDKWFKKDALVSTLLGAALALAGVGWAHRLQAKQKARDEEMFKNNLLRALRRETEILGKIYTQGMAPKVSATKPSDFLNTKFSLTQNWFTIYETNAAHLGRLDADVATKLIVVYNLIKALIEYLRINNQYLEEYEGTNGLRREDLRPRLIEHAKAVRECHQSLETATDELYEMLDQRGIE